MFSSTRVLSEMMMMMKSISTEIFFYRTVSKNWPMVIFPSVNSNCFFIIKFSFSISIFHLFLLVLAYIIFIKLDVHSSCNTLNNFAIVTVFMNFFVYLGVPVFRYIISTVTFIVYKPLIDVVIIFHPCGFHIFHEIIQFNVIDFLCLRLNITPAIHNFIRW